MATGKRKRILIRGTYFDYPSLFLIVFLLLFGLMMVYSISSYKASVSIGDSAYYAKRQLLFGGVGFIVMLLVSKIRYQILRTWSMVIIILTVLLLLSVFVIGKASNGSTRWINIGVISFQPSEIAKLSLIIYTAHICTAKSGYLKTFIGTAIVMLIPIGCVVIIAVENLSTAVICAVIVIAIWFVATPKPIYLLFVAIGGALFLYLFITFFSYRGDRLEAWRDPEHSANGYQTMQALYAIGSGGLFGRGLGQSVQKLGYIPEAHNDMIFSVVCEELGIIGGAALIIVFVLLLWRFRFIAEGAPDRFGALLVVGVIAHLGFQVILNISVVTNLLPNTGVTLPFISYGGSSLSFLLLELGVVLSVSRQIVPIGNEKEVAR